MRYLSLFSGMEAAYLAWHPLGWECAGVAEVDPRACEVLAHRLNASAPKYLPDGFDPKRYAHLPPFGSPGTLPNFGDVSQVTDDDVAALGHVDVLIGGSPCQDLSVAGKRAGLAGARSGLFHEQLRIFHAARHLCGARWLVWENVPGAFSSNAGRDFAVVVGDMAGLELAVPEDGWGNEGLALGANGLVEWSVLDAQWFGVAQRRRRVFAVLDTGNWVDRPPVLLEPDRLRGDSPPRREAWEGTAAGAEARAVGGGEAGAPGAGARWPADVACTLNAAFGSKQGLEDQHVLGDDVAHTLRADGFDASEDGTGRGTPLVPVHVDPVAPTLTSGPSSTASHGKKSGTDREALVALGVDVYNGAITGEVAATMGTRGSSENATRPQVLAFAQNQRDEVRQMDVAGALAAEPGMKQQTYIAFSCKDHGADAGEISPTLRSMGHDGSHANAGGQVAVAFREVAGALTSQYGKQPDNSDTGLGPNLAGTATAVRRLTPRECERLQGAEDDWTLVPNAKGKPMADGPRYKMLGNSFAVPVIRWIGSRIQQAHGVAA